MKHSVCQTCGKPIEHEESIWPTGWHDPDVLDVDNDGRSCEITGDEHIPGDVL